jgi:S-DNA-T family DNA segregation ATPase FtsK/SpoIIIE
MAPMPIPVLDPNEGKLFVPADINRKLAQEQEAAAKASGNAASAPAEPAPKPLNPAENRDTAIDPIFPKSERLQRHVPKSDRNFDLKNVFIEDIDEIGKEAPKKHSPVPPEVPMPGTRPAARPVTPSTPAVKAQPMPAPKTSAGLNGTDFPSGTVTVKKPAPAKMQKPIVQKVNELGQKDFGLTSEEFERLEAQRAPLPKSMQKKPEAAATAAAQKPAAPAPKAEAKPAPPPKPRRYVFPPITYLHAPEPMTAESREEIEASVNNLSTTLQNFRININAIAYSCGPTVTRYEVTPAAGVRVRSIVNLADDISLAFASKVRIEAPIPGKSAVGIEVPNKNRSNVFLRELIESKQFVEAQSKLTSCLGADVTGKPLLFDIAKMPHLLVAGATGMGKSVCINSIIMSLLYKAKPDEVKLVLIDPKKVEFGIYKGIPHLLAPIVTAPKDAAGALQAAVEEMESRFELIQQVGVHDIKGYNKATENDPDMPFMPQIVIIIDELADLMMTAPDEVETAICRLAQKARAAGMHIIIGTQRPSVDVVTGLIKSNIPSRIAFTVASQVDSRTILDVAGAEKLVGRGDMLFAPVGAMGFTRVQGAFVDEKEVENICEFIRVTNGTATYDERFTSKMKELSAQCGKKGKAADADLSALPEGGGKGDDSKYSDAVRIAVEEKKISTSLLQRKLEVGYSRAAKLIDRMQAEGIVSAPDGSKPRTILITPEEYIAKFIDGQTEE